MHVVCCLVRVPLSIGASDLIETCAPIGRRPVRRMAADLRRSGAAVDSKWIRTGFEIVVTFLRVPFILKGYDSICRRGFQTP